MRYKQQGLGLSVSMDEAIQQLPLKSIGVGSRRVSDRMQKAFLHYLNGFQTKECWMLRKNIANDPKMQKLFAGINERSIRGVILALEQQGLVSLAGKSVRLNIGKIRALLTDTCTEASPETTPTESDSERNSVISLGIFDPDHEPQESGPTVRLDRTSGPLKPDQWSGKSGPAVRSTKENESKEDNTTPETGWNEFEDLLESCNVYAVEAAIKDAKRSFNSEREALDHIRAVIASHKGEVGELGGIVRNQCKNSKKKLTNAPKPPQRTNYITHTHWEDNNRCSIEELKRAYPGRPLEPRLQAMFDSIRKEVSA